MINTPPGRRRADAILDLKSVAELEKLGVTSDRRETLPVPQIVADCS